MQRRRTLLAISTLIITTVIGCGGGGARPGTTTSTTTTAPQPSPAPPATTPPTSTPPSATPPTSTPPGTAPGGSAAEFLYFDAFPTGNVYGYQINSSNGALTPVSGNPFTVKTDTGGSNTCTVGCDRMLLADPQGQFLFFDFTDTSNVHGVAPFAVDPATGSLKQADFHHTVGADISIDPQGRFLYVHGFVSNNNTIGGMALNRAAGTLADTLGSPYLFPGMVAYLPPGASNSFVYAVTFDAQPSIINRWAIDQNTGALAKLAGTNGATTGMIGQTLTPSGQYLYSEQQFTDTGGIIHLEIVGYRINADGSLTALSFAPQQTPDGGVAQLLMSPNGNFLYHVANSNIRAYAIDPSTGTLSLTGVFNIPNLGYVAIDPAVRLVYTAGNSIQGYTVNPTNGALTAISDATATPPETPSSMVIVK